MPRTPLTGSMTAPLPLTVNTPPLSLIHFCQALMNTNEFVYLD